MARAHWVAAEVEALGYENFGEIFIAGRVYLRRRGPPNLNVAITALNSAFWRTQLLVRDYLCANADEVEAYSRSKLNAVASGATMFSSYSRSKAPFLAELVQRTEAWRVAGARGRC
jgi:GrpB-like predicted nucleotidyltransferase (UPF0157 family)